ncbi:MAG: hypothetical protein BEN19_01755 [Epulopiscium sp. Nuni2H_MBin003]|nr:MAG: hypothetical protein BEN19_01755 [Epulopiscium sp. Nuni2H_MBin003]
MYEDEEYEEEPKIVSQTVATPTPQIVKPVMPANKLQQTLTRQEILSITMAEYNVTGEIAKYIKNKRAIIVNMEKLSDPEIQRALDYLSGVSFALDGTVELLTPKIYVMLPEHIKLNKE